MWRELIQSLEPNAIFGPPVPEVQLVQLEKSLHLKLPDDLKSLLRETDGVITEEDGIYLVWPVGKIEEENQVLWHSSGHRDRYMPLDSLLFFADPGVDGIKFAFSIVQRIAFNRIYAWYPIEDDCTRIADSLGQYIERTLKGTLRI